MIVLDYTSAVLQRSNGYLIHTMQTGSCIWGKKVECDRFKILIIQMGGAVINNGYRVVISYSSGFELSFTTSNLRHFSLQNKTTKF